MEYPSLVDKKRENEEYQDNSAITSSNMEINWCLAIKLKSKNRR